MKYILDSDTLIYFLKGHSEIVEKVASISETNLATTIINHTELFFGAFYSEKKEKNIKKIQEFLDSIHIFDFSRSASLMFAEQKALLKKQGNIVADMDLMIASIVLANDGILVTNNVKHFKRIKKLKLENWVMK